MHRPGQDTNIVYRPYWIALSTIVFLLGLAATLFAGRYADRLQRASLTDRARTIAAATDTNDLKRLSGTAADLNIDEYDAIKEEMQRIRGVNADARFVYLMGRRNGQLFFHADSEPPDSEDYSPPGQIYTEASQEKLDNALGGISFAEGPYTDRWGTWVSGYAPITDQKTGAVIGTAGIDINADLWRKQIAYARALPASITFFVLLVIALLYRFRRRQAAFTTRIQEQEGRMKTLYEITTRPNLRLADQFRAALQLGSETLHTRLAIVSRIENRKFTVLYCVVPPDTIKEGDVFPLDKTYCDITVKKREVLAIDHMLTSEYSAHPCYGKFKLESYIGVPVMVNGELYGTINFSSPDPHHPAFSESDRDFVRLMGKWVSASLEHELIEEKKKEIDKMKSEFVSIASHQLRTPLTGIKWFTDLMLRGKAGALAAEQTDFLTQIAESNERMIKLVEDLLNVSRIETGTKFVITKKPTDMIAIIDSLATDLIGIAKQHKVEIKKALNVPKEYTLNVDPEKIRQVFQNLMSNAVKYSHEGGIVEIGFDDAKKKTITFAVRDTGLGIPVNQQSRMFEKFFRADNVQTKETDGTGLGLYIAKAIIEGHGGNIRFESKENKGTTFYISLPT